MEQRTRQRRGFAAMSPEKQKQIASQGGKASHAGGKGHEWNSESARAAALKAVAVRTARKTTQTGEHPIADAPEGTNEQSEVTEERKAS